MQVILNERVKSLGNVGEVVNVSAGYARNYLIPKKFAVVADASNQRFIDNRKRILAKKISEEKNTAMEVKKKIDTLSLQVFKRVAGNGKLFGTVSSIDLVTLLHAQGVDVEKRQIRINPPIKQTGDFEVQVCLVADCIATFKLKVSIDPAQVEEMKKKQEAAKVRKEREAIAESEKSAESAESEESADSQE